MKLIFLPLYLFIFIISCTVNLTQSDWCKKYPNIGECNNGNETETITTYNPQPIPKHLSLNSNSNSTNNLNKKIKNKNLGWCNLYPDLENCKNLGWCDFYPDFENCKEVNNINDNKEVKNINDNLILERKESKWCDLYPDLDNCKDNKNNYNNQKYVNKKNNYDKKEWCKKYPNIGECNKEIENITTYNPQPIPKHLSSTKTSNSTNNINKLKIKPDINTSIISINDSVLIKDCILIPTSTIGEVSETRKQILQNTLEGELKNYFKIISQEKFEEVQEKVFEELDYDECTEDQCIVMIQEMLQVENVFHLQVIGEEGDTQISLSWRNLDEKKRENEFCEGCKTKQLNNKIKQMVSRFVKQI